MAEALVTLTGDNFQDVLDDSFVPVIVDFWSEGCGPCKMMMPLLEQLAIEQAGSVKIGKVNAGECIELCAQFNVTAVPTLLFFKDGKPVDRVSGTLSKDGIMKRLAAVA